MSSNSPGAHSHLGTQYSKEVETKKYCLNELQY